MKIEISHHDRLGSLLLLGVKEIIGSDTAGALANAQERPGSSKDLDQMQSCLENQFGVAVGRGLAIRSGRASFKHILREFGEELGLTGREFLFLPLTRRLNFGSGALVKLFGQYTPLDIEQKIDGESILWTIDHHPGTEKYTAGASACQFMVGILQEALYWFSGGKTFQVEETQCACQGSPCCAISVRKQPL